VNHFYQIFPQPMGNQPLSHELARAVHPGGIEQEM
jgi:hypothetical protein